MEASNHDFIAADIKSSTPKPPSSFGDRDPSIANNGDPEHQRSSSVDTSDDAQNPNTNKRPRISRNSSFSAESSYQDEWEGFPPLDRLTILDILDNFALSQHFEKLQRSISIQREKVRQSQQALKSHGSHARERMVEEWRRRAPSAEEQLERYRQRMRRGVEDLGNRWSDTKAITVREKISFICGVMNVFISGYLLGSFPQYFHIWYTAQLFYFMPIRGIAYHRRGYHYFLADLCYFVNLLLILSLWVFPNSKRMFTSVYCLAFGNNAVAIIMWRNSLVFHSFDKVTSLFIHIMPCAALHCIVHLISPDLQQARFPAAYAIKTAPIDSPNNYATLTSMLAWSSIPYAIWQLSYYFLISIRRRDKILAGRPTSFTWLRRSYAKAWIGRIVLAQPESLQEPIFMVIQYLYAVLTMIPCTLWFSSMMASTLFLSLMFTWSVYNGATFYIDVFGTRFQKELEALKADVARWQHASEVERLSGPGPIEYPAASTNSSDDPGNKESHQEATDTGTSNHTTEGTSPKIVPQLLVNGSTNPISSSIEGNTTGGLQQRK
ncbi:putative membrane protein [Ceratocystis lukuohia]|uniref:Glycerophosphocholine acyltransferase 1 n=1 Tax=Ceratocystis lukuohia TaxID=2019550 RepID=A0ABR4MIQ8_9PEZI